MGRGYELRVDPDAVDALRFDGDPGCPRVVVPEGVGFVDDGHDLHAVRNEAPSTS